MILPLIIHVIHNRPPRAIIGACIYYSLSTFITISGKKIHPILLQSHVVKKNSRAVPGRFYLCKKCISCEKSVWLYEVAKHPHVTIHSFRSAEDADPSAPSAQRAKRVALLCGVVSPLHTTKLPSLHAAPKALKGQHLRRCEKSVWLHEDVSPPHTTIHSFRSLYISCKGKNALEQLDYFSLLRDSVVILDEFSSHLW